MFSSGPGRRRLDWFELVVLAVLAAISLWMVGLNVWSAAVHHRVWTGTDGLYVPDQLQYLAWIRDASHHGLVSDLFVLNPTPHDYLQPAIAISGGLTALGVAPWLALLLWKPVGVLAIFFAVRAYCRRMLSDRWARLAALVLALFFGSFGTFPAVDEWLPFLSWGYPFTLIATAAVVWALLSYERARDQQAFSWAAPALGLLAAWLHPWQGELLILIVLVSEAVFWAADSASRSARRLIQPLVTTAAAALPLLYYAVLDHADPVWRLGRHATLAHHWSLGKALLPLVPLMVAAALSYGRRPRSFLGVATRVWPVATVVVFEFSKRLFAATPLHALTGVTIPLAILAVQGLVWLAGVIRLPRARLLGWALVAAATIPVTVHLMDVARSQRVTPNNGMDFITHDEQRALTFLRKDPKPGGVLADFVLGALIPGETGRRTYLGNCDWSVPRCDWRFSSTFNLFRWHHERGYMARRFVSNSGARFVLARCDTLDPRLAHKLRPLLVSVHRFGCTTVYEVRPGPRYLL